MGVAVDEAGTELLVVGWPKVAEGAAEKPLESERPVGIAPYG
jgi:hypothetical protein